VCPNHKTARIIVGQLERGKKPGGSQKVKIRTRKGEQEVVDKGKEIIIIGKEVAKRS